VQEDVTVSHRTATRYIAMAEDQGYLPANWRDNLKEND
jgi:hypothetical protein